MEQLPQIDVSKGFGSMMNPGQGFTAPQVGPESVGQGFTPGVMAEAPKGGFSGEQFSSAAFQGQPTPVAQEPIAPPPVDPEKIQQKLMVDMEKIHGIDPKHVQELADKASKEMGLPKSADPAKRAMFYIEKNKEKEGSLDAYKMGYFKRAGRDLIKRAGNASVAIANISRDYGAENKEMFDERASKFGERYGGGDLTPEEQEKMNNSLLARGYSSMVPVMPFLDPVGASENALSALAFVSQGGGTAIGEAGLSGMELIDNLITGGYADKKLYEAIESEGAKEIVQAISESKPIEDIMEFAAKNPRAARSLGNALDVALGAFEVATAGGAGSVTKRGITQAGKKVAAGLKKGKDVLPGMPSMPAGLAKVGKVVAAPKKALKGLKDELLKYPMEQQVKTAITNVGEDQASMYLDIAKARQKDVNNRSALYGVTDEMKIKYDEFIDAPLKDSGKQIGDLKDAIKEGDNVSFDPSSAVSKFDDILSKKYNAKMSDDGLVPVKGLSVSADLSPADVSAVLEIREKIKGSDNLFDAIERINDMNKIYKNKMTTAGQIEKNKKLMSYLEEVKQDIVSKIDDQLELGGQYRELNKTYSNLLNLKDKYLPLFMKEKKGTDTISALKKMFGPAAGDVDVDIKDFGALVGRDWASEARIAKHFATKYGDNTVKSLLDATSTVADVTKSALLGRPFELAGKILSKIGEKILGDPDKVLLSMAKKLKGEGFEFDPSKINKLRGVLKQAKKGIKKGTTSKVKAKAKIKKEMTSSIIPIDTKGDLGKYNKTQAFPGEFDQPGMTKTSSNPMQPRVVETPVKQVDKIVNEAKKQTKTIDEQAFTDELANSLLKRPEFQGRSRVEMGSLISKQIEAGSSFEDIHNRLFTGMPNKEYLAEGKRLKKIGQEAGVLQKVDEDSFMAEMLAQKEGISEEKALAKIKDKKKVQKMIKEDFEEGGIDITKGDKEQLIKAFEKGKMKGYTKKLNDILNKPKPKPKPKPSPLHTEAKKYKTEEAFTKAMKSERNSSAIKEWKSLSDLDSDDLNRAIGTKDWENIPEYVTLYRGIDKDIDFGLRPGDFLTLNKKNAESFASKGGRMKKFKVKTADLMGNEFGYQEVVYNPGKTLDNKMNPDYKKIRKEANRK